MMHLRKTLILLLLLLPLASQAQMKLMVNIDDRKILADLKALTIRLTRDTLDQKAMFTENILSAFCHDTITASDSIRIKLAIKAYDYLGVKYHYGQACETGFDCSGYVRYLYLKFGLDLPHSSFAQYNMSKHINREKARPGDLVFFATRSPGASHVGIYIGNNKFIHAPGRGGSVSVCSLEATYYKRRLVGFGSVLQ